MLVCVFLCIFAHETAGAARTRLSLRPLLIERGQTDATLGRIAPRECGRASYCCLTIESEIHAASRRSGERFARCPCQDGENSDLILMLSLIHISEPTRL